MRRKEELKFAFLVFFLKEGEGLSPKDAALPAPSPGTRYKANPTGKFGVNVDVE